MRYGIIPLISLLNASINLLGMSCKYKKLFLAISLLFIFDLYFKSKCNVRFGPASRQYCSLEPFFRSKRGQWSAAPLCAGSLGGWKHDRREMVVLQTWSIRRRGQLLTLGRSSPPLSLGRGRWRAASTSVGERRRSSSQHVCFTTLIVPVSRMKFMTLLNTEDRRCLL